jgi:hypothetical protein
MAAAWSLAKMINRRWGFDNELPPPTVFRKRLIAEINGLPRAGLPLGIRS